MLFVRHRSSTTAGGRARTQTSWNQGKKKKRPRYTKLEEIKTQICTNCTERNDTVWTLMVQNFKLISLQHRKEEPPCRRSILGTDFRPSVCFYQWVMEPRGSESIFMSPEFPAKASKVSREVPSSSVEDLASCRSALSLALTQVCLANYSSSPTGPASDIWCYVHLLLCDGLLPNRVH